MDLVQNFGLENAFWAGATEFWWPAMSVALGLVDGFNPCAMWTLFILLGFLIGLESRKTRWLIGGVFIASSALIYFGALLAYLLGFKFFVQMLATSAMNWVFLFAGILAVGAGGLALLQARKKQIACEIRSPESQKKFAQKLRSLLDSKKLWLILPGVVALAFSVNAFELLCSFAIPTIFTAAIVRAELEFWQQISALLIYDAAYIFDDVLVFAIAIKTLSLKIFSPKWTIRAHFAGGILLLLIGLFLIFDSSLFIAIFA